jgi:hypothetical protein
MFKALVLVRNLESGMEGLDFGEFTVKPVGFRFKELRETFSSVDVNQDDWVFEKSYNVPPAASRFSSRQHTERCRRHSASFSFIQGR